MSSDEYPTLKLKYDSIAPIIRELSLNGIPIPRVAHIKIFTPNKDGINSVTIELLAKLDIESPVEVNKELVTYVGGEKYKLVKMDESEEVN